MSWPGRPVEAPRLAAGLHLVATPIGNLRDVTLRALETLAAADVIACEDTRVTRKLLDHYGIATPLTPYHEHNAAAARPKLLARLAAGEAVALVSDAGTPLISDPGLQAGARGARGRSSRSPRCPAPPRRSRRWPSRACRPTGSSSKDSCRRRTASAGRASPSLRASRRRSSCTRAGRAWRATLRRWPRGSARAQAAVCRELTKLHEEVRRGELAALARALAGRRRDARRDRHRGRAAGRRRRQPDAGRGRRAAAARLAARVGEGCGQRSRRRHRPAAARNLSARARAQRRRSDDGAAD